VRADFFAFHGLLTLGGGSVLVAQFQRWLRHGTQQPSLEMGLLADMEWLIAAPPAGGERASAAVDAAASQHLA
jgi:hypothetical protein